MRQRQYPVVFFRGAIINFNHLSHGLYKELDNGKFRALVYFTNAPGEQQQSLSWECGTKDEAREMLQELVALAEQMIIQEDPI